MKRFCNGLLASALVLSLLLTGCGAAGGQQPAQASGSEQPAVRTVTDAEGNVVEVPQDISRIAVTPLPWSSVVSAIDGGSQRLVSINPGALKAYSGSFFAKLDKNYAILDDTSIGSDFSINVEELLNRQVQAVIIWEYQTAEAAKLKDVGIVPVMVKNGNVQELQDSFKAVGQLLGKEERAKWVNDEYAKAYEKMKSFGEQVKKADKPRVLYLKRSDLTLQGNDNFIKESMELAGADNIAAEAKSITMEEILKLDPEIILLSDFDKFLPQDLYENRIEGQDWSSVSAVVNKRVYKTPVGIYRWDAPGVETPLMMFWLGKMLQPEIFSEVDLKAEMKAFYQDVFDYSLTDEDFGQIFNDKANAASERRIS